MGEGFGETGVGKEVAEPGVEGAVLGGGPGGDFFGDLPEGIHVA